MAKTDQTVSINFEPLSYDAVKAMAEVLCGFPVRERDSAPVDAEDLPTAVYVGRVTAVTGNDEQGKSLTVRLDPGYRWAMVSVPVTGEMMPGFDVVGLEVEFDIVHALNGHPAIVRFELRDPLAGLAVTDGKIQAFVGIGNRLSANAHPEKLAPGPITSDKPQVSGTRASKFGAGAYLAPTHGIIGEVFAVEHCVGSGMTRVDARDLPVCLFSQRQVALVIHEGALYHHCEHCHEAAPDIITIRFD